MAKEIQKVLKDTPAEPFLWSRRASRRLNPLFVIIVELEAILLPDDLLLHVAVPLAVTANVLSFVFLFVCFVFLMERLNFNGPFCPYFCLFFCHHVHHPHPFPDPPPCLDQKGNLNHALKPVLGRVPGPAWLAGFFPPCLDFSLLLRSFFPFSPFIFALGLFDRLVYRGSFALPPFIIVIVREILSAGLDHSLTLGWLMVPSWFGERRARSNHLILLCQLYY